MAVTVTTNTLSTRVRYLNVSASTANTDAKDIVLAMANALIALGWSRYDTAGETAVVGSDDNAGVVLRRECYDFAQSGHYNYLGLRLVGSGTNTYTFYLIQAADWSSTTSMSAFVSAAATSVFTPNTTGRTDFLNFDQGGTIWLFDSGKTLLITSQSGSTLVKGMDSTWVVGEYQKEYGENVDAATGYIHNGLFTCNRWLMDGNGIGGSVIPAHTTVQGASINISATSNSQKGAQYFYTGDYSTTSSFSAKVLIFALGGSFSQFSLTEAPTASVAENALSRYAAAPTSCGNSFTTRLLMGPLGYIGHLGPYTAISINYAFGFFENGVNLSNSPTTMSNSSFNQDGIPFTSFGGMLLTSTKYSLFNSIKEYAMNTLPTALKFNVFEPTLSSGTTNGLIAVTGFTTPPQYKFSLLGKIFDLKIFGPYGAEKYVFLDSMTIPCNADGFYQEGGTNKDFWIIPTSNFTAFVMPK